MLRCVVAYSYGRLINSAEVPTQIISPLNTPFMCLPSVCFVEPGLNLVILGQIKTKPGCVVCVCSVSAHLWTLALQDMKGTHMLRFPTKWWKLRKACMHYKEYEVKVNVVDSRGKCCPSCLAHSTGFPTIVISKIDNAAHYSQTIVSFSGTNYKKKQKKSTRPVIVTELWRTVPFCSCHSLQRNVDMMRKNMLKTLLHSPLFEPYLIWNALLYMSGVTQYK